jgi:muramoyltetrapeptide carboxypeptidase LdcA involved in peptidoglycan recycling
MFDYTKEAVKNILFKDTTNYEIKSSEYWSDDFVSWKEENKNIVKKLVKETHGYEVLSGKGVIRGELLGGCLDVFPMILETEIWPKKDEWKGKIMLLETSEEKIPPEYVLYYMRNLGAQGVLNNIKGIIVGKPQDEKYYEEYKEMYLKVLKEFNCEDLPIIYNVNIGHAYGTGLLPLGVEYEVDLDKKQIKILESATLN